MQLPTNRSVGRLPYAPHFLTAEEVEAIADYLTTANPDAPWGSLVRFMAWTGLRTGEVAGLNIGDVDLLRGTVTVRRTRSVRGGVWTEHTPKSGRSRVVPLVPWVGGRPRESPRGAPDPERPEGTAVARLAPRRGGRWSPKSADQRSGAVDFSSPWEAGTFVRRRSILGERDKIR